MNIVNILESIGQARGGTYSWKDPIYFQPPRISLVTEKTKKKTKSHSGARQANEGCCS